MRFIRKLLTSFLILVLILPSFVSLLSTPVVVEQKSVSGFEISADLTSRGPISITGNSDFGLQGFDGSGIPGDPYIIEGFRIVSDIDCISVSDTTSYFVIRDCELYSNSDRQGQGVYLNNVTHGTIENCTMWEKLYAIHFEKSPLCSAIGNIIHDNTIGIRVYDGSDNCTIYGNHIYDQQGHLGIYLWYRSAYCHLENNILEGDFVSIQGWSSESWNHTMVDNLVNGKPLGYFQGMTDVTLDGEDYGQIILSHCIRVTVDGGRFKDCYSPVMLGYSTNCTVKNVRVENGYSRGIYVEYGYGNLVTNNTVVGSDIGIFSDGGTNMEIVTNTVTGCNEGIRVSSEETDVMNNTVGESSQVGIYIWRNDCVVSGNIVYDCNTGIDLWYSDYTNCTWNTVVRCTLNGINVNGGTFNFIAHNVIVGNENNGISIVEWVSNTGSNNTVFGNELGWNYAGNCYDTGSNNSWDDGSGTGNSYHDYVSGTYSIDGTAGSVDNYPTLLDDTDAPVIDPTPDASIIVGLPGTFQWNVTEDYPKAFALQRNAITIDSGTWIGSSYIVDLDGLVAATYTFTLSVEDYVHGLVSDSVIITVQNRISHAPILITTNSDFVNQGFSGGGSSTNPYVIENLTITTDEVGIEISGVTAHFVVRNCYVEDTATEPGGNYGIFIHDSQNGLVEYCEVTKKNHGVYFLNVDSSTVSNSILHFNNMGIHFDSVYSCSIIGNTLYNNLYSRGILLYGTTENLVVRNNVLTDESIYIANAYDQTCWVHSFSDNTVNGKPVGYFLDRSNFRLAGTPYAQVILARCTNVTVFDGQFSNVVNGMAMGYCQGCTFTSNTILAVPGSNMDWSSAMYIAQSTEVIVTGIHIDGPFQEGITVNFCEGAIIKSNLIENAGTAIVVDESDYAVVQSNSIPSCWRGMTIGSDYTQVLSNTITDSRSHGIELRSAMYCIVNGNSISDSQRSGIELDASNHSLIIWNSFINSGEYGIALIDFSHAPFNNTLYGNFIGWNDDGNAFDEGLSNTWDDNISQGNYWSDWGRVPIYNIPGTAGSVDRYSFATDYGPPTLSSPADYIVESGSPDHQIEWTAVDESPYWYETFKNGTLLQSMTWQSSSIQEPVWNYSLGVYNLTIVVEDLAGNLVSDTVIVSVVDTTAPILNQPEDMQILNGTTGEFITWTPTDLHPHSYWIQLDGVNQTEGQWTTSGVDIVQSLDGLSVGAYNYTIVAQDTSGNIGSSTVLVIVLEEIPTTTGTPTQPTENPLGTLSVAITAASIGVILVVAILSYRSRQGSKWVEAMEGA